MKQAAGCSRCRGKLGNQFVWQVVIEVIKGKGWHRSFIHVGRVMSGLHTRTSWRALNGEFIKERIIDDDGQNRRLTHPIDPAGESMRQRLTPLRGALVSRHALVYS